METLEKTEEAQINRLGKVASDEEWNGLTKAEQRAYVKIFNGCKH
jgi:hypothetical protein